MPQLHVALDGSFMKLACSHPHPKATLPQATRRCYPSPVDPLKPGGGGIPAHGWAVEGPRLPRALRHDLLRTQCVFVLHQISAPCCRRCSHACPSSCCVALRGSGGRGMNCLMHLISMFLGKGPRVQTDIAVWRRHSRVAMSMATNMALH